jgi:hypothetical protein
MYFETGSMYTIMYIQTSGPDESYSRLTVIIHISKCFKVQILSRKYMVLVARFAEDDGSNSCTSNIPQKCPVQIMK